MSFYLDASILVPLFVAESRSEVIANWLANASGSLHVSDFAAAEFSASLSRLVRVGTVKSAEAAALHSHFDFWRNEAVEALENLPADIRMAAHLVRTPFPKLLSRDALHLATCLRLGLTLVTHDEELQQIAQREHVSTFSPA